MPVLPTPDHQDQPAHFHRIGQWLPDDHRILIDWVRQLVNEVDKKNERRARAPGATPVYSQPVQELDDLIKGNSALRMLATSMFLEIPNKPPYDNDPNGNKQVRDYEHMLQLFDHIMQGVAPIWSETQYGVGLIGFPFNAILDWPMATQSGYAFFLNEKVNLAIKKILETWSKDVLMTWKSQYVLNTDRYGWLSEEALTTIEADTNTGSGPPEAFDKVFKCDTSQDHWGFKSWDDFFVRQFKDMDTSRPVAKPDDPSVLANSCESKPFNLERDVKAYDNFWLKGQPYSVLELLNHHKDADDFVGGTVYQAFLSATSYHRWNSPVGGTVVYAGVVPGTYFSEPVITGFNRPDGQGPDPAAPEQAQGYISHVATRAIFLIRADPPIGLMAVVHVGMADVSSCEITVHEGETVAKGQEIGMFHHGGSTHCVLLRKGLNVEMKIDMNTKKNIPIRSELAVVS